MIQHSKTTLSESDVKSILETLKSGLLTSGSKVESFKEALTSYTGVAHCLTASSGSQALSYIVGLLCSDQKKNVLIPKYICVDVYETIIRSGGVPVQYDCEGDNWNAGFNQIHELIDENTAFVVVNHCFGIRNDCISEIKRKFKELIIVEDCCNALVQNGVIGDGKIYSGDLLFFSFNSTKTIATGEGGAIMTNNIALIQRLETMMVDQGFSDLNASLGLSQLKSIDEFNTQREKVAGIYFEELPNHFISRSIKFDSCFFRFPIWVENPDKFLNETSEVVFRRGVDKLASGIIGDTTSFTNSNKCFNHTVSLPIYPSLTWSEQKRVINSVIKIGG